MAGTDTAPGQEEPVRRRRRYGMRERLSAYFLLAVLVPLGFGVAISEYLIERHAAGLGHNLAEERLESITSRLTERARALELAMVQTAATPGLLTAVTE